MFLKSLIKALTLQELILKCIHCFCVLLQMCAMCAMYWMCLMCVMYVYNVYHMAICGNMYCILYVFYDCTLCTCVVCFVCCTVYLWVFSVFLCFAHFSVCYVLLYSNFLIVLHRVIRTFPELRAHIETKSAYLSEPFLHNSPSDQVCKHLNRAT